MKKLLMVLCLLAFSATVFAGEVTCTQPGCSPNWNPAYPHVVVDALAKSGAICERYGHNWKDEIMHQLNAVHLYNQPNTRKCQICDKTQIRSMDWRDYEGKE